MILEPGLQEKCLTGGEAVFAHLISRKWTNCLQIAAVLDTTL